MNHKPLVVLVGPTAVGKTALSIRLAKRFHGEIVSGDSMQVYRGMDIGTAKITHQEMAGIPHHMLDIVNPDDPFSVADFQAEAKRAINSLHNQNKLPLLVGGTGLYVNAVMYNYHFSEAQGDPVFRDKMEIYAQEHGKDALHNKLQTIDPVSYRELHPNNMRRVIRALEVYHLTGKPLRSNENEPQSSSYSPIVIGLTMERELLYDRINERVDMMVETGLFEEVEQLYKAGYRHCQSMQAIGYKEIMAYYNGELTKEAAIDLLKRNSRRFAKRQLTWFRNKMTIHWFNMTDEREKREKEIEDFLAGKLL
ncbi:tRNA (adenosine(37)-N6)-dimethylallyltransferase MiaA [Salipaludibacillus sp. LMS25]|nr:tRNA (adenosine(37)-N6)-dimethylallyltransferase MiaA [Salipaludibacillus sp. LMS25]